MEGKQTALLRVFSSTASAKLKYNLIIREMLKNGGRGAAALRPMRFRSVANCTSRIIL